MSSGLERSGVNIKGILGSMLQIVLFSTFRCPTAFDTRKLIRKCLFYDGFLTGLHSVHNTTTQQRKINDCTATPGAGHHLVSKYIYQRVADKRDSGDCHVTVRYAKPFKQSLGH